MFFTHETEPLNHGHELCSELEAFLQQNKASFEHKLIVDLSHIDHMAHNLTGINIDKVVFVNGQQYQLEYSFDWELNRGCSDIHDHGVQHERVAFIIESNGFININFPIVDSRDTCDEF